MEATQLLILLGKLSPDDWSITETVLSKELNELYHDVPILGLKDHLNEILKGNYYTQGNVLHSSSHSIDTKVIVNLSRHALKLHLNKLTALTSRSHVIYAGKTCETSGDWILSDGNLSLDQLSSLASQAPPTTNSPFQINGVDPKGAWLEGSFKLGAELKGLLKFRRAESSGSEFLQVVKQLCGKHLFVMAGIEKGSYPSVSVKGGNHVLSFGGYGVAVVCNKEGFEHSDNCKVILAPGEISVPVAKRSVPCVFSTSTFRGLKEVEYYLKGECVREFPKGLINLFAEYSLGALDLHSVVYEEEGSTLFCLTWKPFFKNSKVVRFLFASGRNYNLLFDGLKELTTNEIFRSYSGKSLDEHKPVKGAEGQFKAPTLSKLHKGKEADHSMMKSGQLSRSVVAIAHQKVDASKELASTKKNKMGVQTEAKVSAVAHKEKLDPVKEKNEINRIKSATSASQKAAKSEGGKEKPTSTVAGGNDKPAKMGVSGKTDVKKAPVKVEASTAAAKPLAKEVNNHVAKNATAAIKNNKADPKKASTLRTGFYKTPVDQHVESGVNGACGSNDQHLIENGTHSESEHAVFSNGHCQEVTADDLVSINGVEVSSAAPTRSNTLETLSHQQSSSLSSPLSPSEDVSAASNVNVDGEVVGSSGHSNCAVADLIGLDEASNVECARGGAGSVGAAGDKIVPEVVDDFVFGTNGAATTPMKDLLGGTNDAASSIASMEIVDHSAEDKEQSADSNGILESEKVPAVINSTDNEVSDDIGSPKAIKCELFGSVKSEGKSPVVNGISDAVLADEVHQEDAIFEDKKESPVAPLMKESEPVNEVNDNLIVGEGLPKITIQSPKIDLSGITGDADNRNCALRSPGLAPLTDLEMPEDDEFAENKVPQSPSYLEFVNQLEKSILTNTEPVENINEAIGAIADQYDDKGRDLCPTEIDDLNKVHDLSNVSVDDEEPVVKAEVAAVTVAAGDARNKIGAKGNCVGADKKAGHGKDGALTSGKPGKTGKGVPEKPVRKVGKEAEDVVRVLSPEHKLKGSKSTSHVGPATEQARASVQQKTKALNGAKIKLADACYADVFTMDADTVSMLDSQSKFSDLVKVVRADVWCVKGDVSVSFLDYFLSNPTAEHGVVYLVIERKSEEVLAWISSSKERLSKAGVLVIDEDNCGCVESTLGFRVIL